MVTLFFVCGLSFFLLGILIFSYPKSQSRFSLARNLWLIGLFGIAHGIHEWVDMFMVLQPEEALFLQTPKTFLLSFSYSLLLYFGLKKVLEKEPKIYFFLRLLPGGLLCLWAFLTLTSPHPFLKGDIYGRYLLGIPGTLFTSGALYLYIREIKEYNISYSNRTLLASALFFFFYGLFAGVVVPTDQFFPASYINEEAFLQRVGVPVQVFRALCAVGISGSLVGTLNIFKWEYSRNQEVLLTNLQIAHSHLEEIVVERTQSLQETNQKLEREIQDRKKAEEEQRLLKKGYQELVDSMDAIIWEADGAIGHFTFVSKQAEAILGYPAEEWLKNPSFFWDRVHSGDRTETLSFFQNLLQHKPVEGIEYRMATADGRDIWLRNFISQTGDGDPSKRIKGMMIDITKLKEAEQERERIHRQLLQVEKMEAIGTLAGGIAHEFNNLLTIMLGHAELAMKKVEQTHRVYRDLRTIHQTIDRSSNLVRKLLLFSKKQTTISSVLNFNHVISDLMEMLTRIIGENIEVQIDLSSDLWPGYSDSSSIEQIITNLILNARDAMEEGGKLTISTKNVTISKEEVRKNPKIYSGKFICLSVGDSGTGISPVVISHIFEPFYTTKEVGSGTGLGLSVVYGLVKENGGWIEVESQPGQGSLFKVFLPALEEEHQQQETSTLAGEEKKMKERILIIEDEEKIRRLARMILEDSHYRVWDAGTGKEALDIFEREKGNFDLIFSDVVLPDTNGVTLAGLFLEKKPDVKILLTSGYTQKKSREEDIQEKNIPFIEKPYSFSTLIDTIRNLLPGKKE